MCASDVQKKKKKNYAKYSTKDLKGRDPNNSFSVLDVYLSEKIQICSNPIAEHF